MGGRPGRPRADRPATVTRPPSPDPDPLLVETLSLLSQGRTWKATAAELGRAEITIRRRVAAYAAEIGVGTTTEAIVHAVRIGLI